jgi:ABC transporter substrate binding protein
MRRRDLNVLLSSAAFGWRLMLRLMLVSAAGPLMLSAGLAQPVKQHRIAYLSAGLHTSEARDFFKEAMQGLGYGEAELSIESRYAEGDSQRLPGLAAELVRTSPEIIVTGSAAAAVAAKQATSSIPIVTIFTADPVGSGLAASLARPGGNLTGLSNIMEDTAGKELELLKTAAPNATRIAILTNPGNPAHAKELNGVREAAAALGAELVPIEIRAPGEIEKAFAAIKGERRSAGRACRSTLHRPCEAHRRFRGEAEATGDVWVSRACDGGWTDELRAGSKGQLSARGGLCRQDSQRSQTGRFAYRAADESRAGHQHENGEGARADHPAIDPRPRR